MFDLKHRIEKLEELRRCTESISELKKHSDDNFDRMMIKLDLILEEVIKIGLIAEQSGKVLRETNSTLEQDLKDIAEIQKGW